MFKWLFKNSGREIIYRNGKPFMILGERGGIHLHPDEIKSRLQSDYHKKAMEQARQIVERTNNEKKS